MNYFLFILITCISFSCNGQNCSTLPNKFSSYNQAITKVENSNFKVSESVNTSKSSWISNVHYYSCDGKTGFFIIELKRKTYIHANMPISVWQGFKKAVSFGSYYDHHIRHKFFLNLN
ncbi:MAG: KTSC domain-containing protein [Ferruginibacter sp.]